MASRLGNLIEAHTHVSEHGSDQEKAKFYMNSANSAGRLNVGRGLRAANIFHDRVGCWVKLYSQALFKHQRFHTRCYRSLQAFYCRNLKQ